MTTIDLADYNQAPAQSGVYAIVHTTKNRWYIGGSVNIKKRLGQHASHLRYKSHSNLLLQADYDLDGIRSFHIEIIDPIPIEELRSAEIKAIRQCSGELYNGNMSGTGRSPLVPGELTVNISITVTPEDFQYLFAISPVISKAIRQVIKERKERT